MPLYDTGRCRVSLLNGVVGKRMCNIHAVEAGESRFPSKLSKNNVAKLSLATNKS